MFDFLRAFGSVILLVLMILLCSCKSEEPEDSFSQRDILGRWELASAQVDGKDTDRLRNLYFVFLPDTSLQTNILGSETNFKFSLADRIIEQNSQPKIIYQLLHHTDSTLQIQTELRGKQFSMLLEKAKPKTKQRNHSTPAD